MPKVTSLRRLLILLGVWAIIAATAVDDDQELRNIEILIDAGNTRLALNYLDRYADRRPDDPRALFLEARAREKAGQTYEAAKIYEQLIRDHPRLPEPFINLAAIHIHDGQYDKARQLLVAALNTHATYAKIYASLNNLHASMASRAYKNALSLEGDAAKPEPSTVGALLSWSAATAADTAVAGGAPPLSAGVASVAASPPVEKAKVRPAPPITEPVKVASRAAGAANNGQVVSQNASVPKPPATRSQPVRADRAAVEITLKSWARAWSRQQVGRYLSFYSNRFRPNNGLSRKQWKQQRKLRITAKKKIHVELSDLTTSVNGGTATVSFRQTYHSDTFSDVVRKKLILERGAEGWKILRETTAS